ncbi:MAG: hypothetical protein EBX39_04700 [Actinobacteria bacterium]|nr:hypothetical protein [Actinomycetota bacterium]
MRMVSTVCTFAFIAMFFVAPSIMGSPLFIIPTIIFLVAGIATVRDARRTDSPDSQTLEPGALAAATKKQPVEVDGQLFVGGATRASAISGRLRFADRRLAFSTTDGSTRFDVPIGKVALAGVPGFLRPQLDLVINGSNHTVRFLPVWDLGATFVGPIIAGEWYAQLRDQGAS